MMGRIQNVYGGHRCQPWRNRRQRRAQNSQGRCVGSARMALSAYDLLCEMYESDHMRGQTWSAGHFGFRLRR